LAVPFTTIGVINDNNYPLASDVTSGRASRMTASPSAMEQALRLRR
jgi:hypothetical protein